MMNTILRALRSPGAMMIALVGILAAQGEHTAQVIEFFSHSGGVALAYAFAGAIEVAVLLFVLNGHKRISYGFAVATFFTNVIYYAIGGIELMSIAILPVLLLSILPPAAIVGYSHTIAGTLHTEPQTDDKPATVSRWQFWRKPTETPAAQPTSNTTTPAPIATPSESGGHSEGVAQTGAAAAQPEGGKSKVSPETKAIILRSIDNGAKLTDVAAEFDVSPNTVRSWIARASKQTNGTGVH